MSRRSYAAERILDHYPYLTEAQVAERLRFGNFLSLTDRYLYFPIAKAGCSTIITLLRKIENAPPLIYQGSETRREMFIHERINVPLLSLADLDSKTQEEVLTSRDFLRMIVVRNPYSRLVSAWRSKVLTCEGQRAVGIYAAVKGHPPEMSPARKSLISFPEFVEFVKHEDLRTCDSHWRLQTDHVFLKAIDFNLVGKTEKMSEALDRFHAHVGIPAKQSSQVVNESILVGTVEYSPGLVEDIFNLYREDFEAFGYDAKTWPIKPAVANPPENIPAEKFLDEIIERNIILAIQQERIQELEARLAISPIAMARRAISTLKRLGVDASQLLRRTGPARGGRVIQSSPRD